MADNFADNLEETNPFAGGYSPAIKPDGRPVEDSSSTAVNLSRRTSQARQNLGRQNEAAEEFLDQTKNQRRQNRLSQAANYGGRQLAGQTLKGAGQVASKAGEGAGRVAGATIGAGVGAIGGGLATGGPGIMAGARSGMSKGQQIGGRIGKFGGDQMRRSGALLNKSGKNQAKSKLSAKVSEKMDAVGMASKEGSRMLLNTCWASVWVDFTFISLIYLNCHLFASKMMPQLVCQFGEDDVIGTWLGGGRLGKVSGAVGVDGKALAEVVEILILVVLDLFVLALISLIIIILYTIYDMITNPGSTILWLIWEGEFGLMWQFFKA